MILKPRLLSPGYQPWPETLCFFLKWYTISQHWIISKIRTLWVCGSHTELHLCSLLSDRKDNSVWLYYNYKDILSLLTVDRQDSRHAFTLTMGLLKAACLEWGTSLAPPPRAKQLPVRWFEDILPKGPLRTILQLGALGFAILLREPLGVSAESSSSEAASW